MTTYASLLLITALLIVLALICHRHQTRRHQQRLQQGITIACDLLSLTKSIQQHRGISSAILGGKEGRGGQLKNLAQNVETGFSRLREHMPEKEQAQLQSIYPKWQHLSRHWQQSGVLESFELHCELIRQLQSLMQNLTDMCGLTSCRYDERRLLAGQIFAQLPSVIENLGQLRALSAHAAVRHSCITAFRLHLQYLLEQLNRQTEDLKKQHKSQPRVEQISEIILLIKEEILGSKSINIDSEQLFKSVTQVMENCYSDIDLGVSQLSAPRGYS